MTVPSGPATQKPVLLVDVDGVLNPFAHRGDFAPGWETYQIEALHLGNPKTFRVFLWAKHGSWLDELETDFELIWATTWEEQANTLIGPKIGLVRHWPVAEIAWRMSGYNKTMGIEELIGDRPAAWIDDEPGSSGLYWRDERLKRGIPTLILTPDPAVGLTRAHKDKLHRFAASLRG